MFNFKNSFAAFAGVCLFVCSLATLLSPTRGQVNNPGGPPQFGLRRFYLTNTKHDGSQALTACANGYHMASLWEILDPSNLRYDTTLGFTNPDSGSGPPSSDLINGWIRTGANTSSGLATLGDSNCGTSAGPWTSADMSVSGTQVGLRNNNWSQTTNVTITSPWTATGNLCGGVAPVWCVQD